MTIRYPPFLRRRRRVPPAARRVHGSLKAAGVTAPASAGAPDVPPPMPAARATHGHLDDLDVLVVLFGSSVVRADAVVRTFARWDATYDRLPTVTCAWCYREGGAPEPLERLPEYPWLRRLCFPEYDRDDGIFRKEGLINLLIRSTSAPCISAVDADLWSHEPDWFVRQRDFVRADPWRIGQPYGLYADTIEPQRRPSLCAQLDAGGYPWNGVPGGAWMFSRRWAEAHDDIAVMPPMMISGGGDTVFALEHLHQTFIDAGRTKRGLRYRYLWELCRECVPPARVGLLPDVCWHENHTDFSLVPAEARTRLFVDRAYYGSRVLLDLIQWRDHVRLDERAVPVADPDGALARILRRKPELQTLDDVRRVCAEEGMPCEL